MRSFYTHLNKFKSRCLVYHLTVINSVSFTALPMMYCTGSKSLGLTQNYVAGSGLQVHLCIFSECFVSVLFFCCFFFGVFIMFISFFSVNNSQDGSNYWIVDKIFCFTNFYVFLCVFK